MADPDRPTSDPAMQEKLARLREILRALSPVVVAFSGGADSALLAWVARDTLGRQRARAITAVSASLAPEEEVECRALADEWDLDWTPVFTNELADPAYSLNDGQRCYHCKVALMDAAAALAAPAGAAEGDGAGPGAGRADTVVLGVNVDDLGEHRPGQQAAAERGARFPLVEAGLSKQEVRSLSRQLGLRTWDKPAAACLASRIPYGTPVTLSTLDAVAVAESGLRRIGFRQVRVRHYGDLARVELDPEQLHLALERRHEVVLAVQAGGYRYVTLDLEGFRTGNLNQVLDRAGAPVTGGVRR